MQYFLYFSFIFDIISKIKTLGGYIMNIKTNKNLLKEAIESGCKTAAQLAHFIKVRNMIQESYIAF